MGVTLRGEELGERLVAALELSGLTVLVESDLRDRPLLLTVRHGGLTQRLRIFLWNATPGGPPGVRAATEFRVQTTRPGDQPLLADETRTTLLLGYHEDLDVFKAWDARVHPNPGSSSSLQVPLEALEEAASDGFASRLRAITDAEEVVVTFSPENVATYVEILGPFQAVVEEPDDSPLGQTVTSGKEPPRRIYLVTRNGDTRRERSWRRCATLASGPVSSRPTTAGVPSADWILASSMRLTSRAFMTLARTPLRMDCARVRRITGRLTEASCSLPMTSRFPLTDRGWRSWDSPRPT